MLQQQKCVMKMDTFGLSTLSLNKKKPSSSANVECVLQQTAALLHFSCAFVVVLSVSATSMLL